MKLVIEHFLAKKEVVSLLREKNILFTIYSPLNSNVKFSLLEIDKDILSKKEMQSLLDYISFIDRDDYLTFLQNRFQNTDYIHFEILEELK